MSNDATVKFGFDGRELNAGLAASERRLVQFGNTAEATGARMTVTMMNELRRRGGGMGAAALCGGGGQGDALLLRTL